MRVDVQHAGKSEQLKAVLKMKIFALNDLRSAV